MLYGVRVLVLFVCVVFVRVVCDVWRDGAWCVFWFCCCLCVCCCLICLCDVCIIYDVLLYGLLFVLFCSRACGLSCNGYVLMRALLPDVVWFVFHCVLVFVCAVFCV